MLVFHSKIRCNLIQLSFDLKINLKKEYCKKFFLSREISYFILFLIDKVKNYLKKMIIYNNNNKKNIIL